MGCPGTLSLQHQSFRDVSNLVKESTKVFGQVLNLIQHRLEMSFNQIGFFTITQAPVLLELLDIQVSGQ